MKENQILFYADLVIMILSGLLSFLGNLPVILTFIKCKRVRNNTTRPLVSLACADILVIFYVALYVPLQLTHRQYATYDLTLTNKDRSNLNSTHDRMEINVNSHTFLSNKTEDVHKEYIRIKEPPSIMERETHTMGNASQTDHEINHGNSDSFHTWRIFCRISKAVSLFIAGCDFGNALLIAVERFCFIVYPLR